MAQYLSSLPQQAGSCWRTIELSLGCASTEGNAAVITWKTGWTTKITNEGGKYKKTAYRKGQALDAPPANSSDAERAK